jgi:hypothetical protein
MRGTMMAETASDVVFVRGARFMAQGSWHKPTVSLSTGSDLC